MNESVRQVVFRCPNCGKLYGPSMYSYQRALQALSLSGGRRCFECLAMPTPKTKGERVDLVRQAQERLRDAVQLIRSATQGLSIEQEVDDCCTKHILKRVDRPHGLGDLKNLDMVMDDIRYGKEESDGSGN